MAELYRSVLTSVVTDVTAVISDIDGTLAHYAKTLAKLGYERLESAPSSWREADKKFEDELDRLLWDCYPQAYRDKRFAAIPCQFWLHKVTGRVVKTYELYNHSLTGAVISENTILLMELLQSKDALFRGLKEPATASVQGMVARKPVVCCLITGARTSTFIRRRHGGSLPQTIFESCEGGSKLWCRLLNPLQWFDDRADLNSCEKIADELSAFYPSNATGIPMDVEWTNKFSEVTGYRANCAEAELAKFRAERRTIWDLETQLVEAGFATDHDHYDTSFLIDIRNSPCVRTALSYNPENAAHLPQVYSDAADAEKFIVASFKDKYNEMYGVEIFVNLGKAQVNAKGGGKRGVMLHVLEKAAELDNQANQTPEMGKKRFCVENTVGLFDDENDLQFAELCGAGILPSVAHEEVLAHQQWRCDPSQRRWFRPPIEGPLGSEWALKQLVAFKRQGAISP